MRAASTPAAGGLILKNYRYAFAATVTHLLCSLSFLESVDSPRGKNEAEGTRRPKSGDLRRLAGTGSAQPHSTYFGEPTDHQLILTSCGNHSIRRARPRGCRRSNWFLESAKSSSTSPLLSSFTVERLNSLLSLARSLPFSQED